MKKHILTLLIACSLSSAATSMIHVEIPEESLKRQQKERLRQHRQKKSERQKKIQQHKMDFRSMYVSAKKAKRVIDKINLLTKVAVQAPKSFWMKKIGKWPNQRYRHKDFKNYVVKLAKKVAKQPPIIKGAYVELLNAAMRNQHLRRYIHDFKKAQARANKKK